MILMIDKQDGSQQNEEDISSLKTFNNLLKEQLLEKLEKSNLKKCKTFFSTSFHDLPTSTKNIHAFYFWIIELHEKNKNNNEKNMYIFENPSIYLHFDEILMIVKKRYESLDDFPLLNENELKEKNDLFELLNKFSK